MNDRVRALLLSCTLASTLLMTQTETALGQAEKLFAEL